MLKVTTVYNMYVTFTFNFFLYILGNETPIKKLLNAKQYFKILINIEIKYIIIMLLSITPYSLYPYPYRYNIS